MTLVGFKEAKAQDYTIFFNGAFVILNKSESVNLTLKRTNFDVSVLNSPVDFCVGQSTYPKYKWPEDTSGVTESYVIEIAEVTDFATITETAIISIQAYLKIRLIFGLCDLKMNVVLLHLALEIPFQRESRNV
jgi:hypothetical protein